MREPITDKISSIAVHNSTKKVIEKLMIPRETYENTILRVFSKVLEESKSK